MKPLLLIPIFGIIIPILTRSIILKIFFIKPKKENEVYYSFLIKIIILVGTILLFLLDILIYMEEKDVAFLIYCIIIKIPLIYYLLRVLIFNIIIEKDYFIYTNILFLKKEIKYADIINLKDKTNSVIITTKENKILIEIAQCNAISFITLIRTKINNNNRIKNEQLLPPKKGNSKRKFKKYK